MKTHPRNVISEIEAQKEGGKGSRTRMFNIVREHIESPAFVKTVEYAYDPFRQYFLTTVAGLANISKSARQTEKEERKGVSSWIAKRTEDGSFSDVRELTDEEKKIIKGD